MSVNAPWTDLSHPILLRFMDKYGEKAGNAESENPVTEAEMTDIILVVSNLLNDLVGGKYPGVAEDIYRPNRNQCCRHERRTGCRWVREIELPFYPVVEITEVLVDGVLVAPDKYKIDDAKWLVQRPSADGVYHPEDRWPCCQRVDLPPTEDETMEIAYTYGDAPPVTGVRAAARWSTELALADIDPESCVMSRELASVSRQGATYVLRARSIIEQRGTGIDDVDNFLAAEMASRQESAGNLIDPYALATQGRPYRRTTWSDTGS